MGGLLLGRLKFTPDHTNNERPASRRRPGVAFEAGAGGLEPPTVRLTVGCSAIELHPIGLHLFNAYRHAFVAPVPSCNPADSLTEREGRAMPRVGVEPTRPCDRGILSPLRLPIPPSGRTNGRPQDARRCATSVHRCRCARYHCGGTGVMPVPLLQRRAAPIAPGAVPVTCRTARVAVSHPAPL